ncbi:hypothetical protein [Kitasatospora sp. NPDC051914]|uniref:hypothetical protein n=1 Tax=Kitasatospora sp. NPDC051914 TaxID=3154945 RepID=UPI003416F19C
MARKDGGPRRMVVGDEVYLWWVRHDHQGDPGYVRGCRNVLSVRRSDAAGRLAIAFAGGSGRLVTDGFLPSGAVATADGPVLNLHEPGIARALLDAALSDGWDPDAPVVRAVDGWPLYAAVVAGRGPSPGSA